HDGHELAAPDVEIDAGERAHCGRPGAEDLGDAAERDERGVGHQLPARTASTTTSSSGASSPARISVYRPSLAPTVTSTGTGTPPRRTHILRALPLSSRGVGGRKRGGPGRRERRKPGLSLSGADSGGVKRSAALGTRSASFTSSTVISAVAVIPGRSSSSELSTTRMAL